MSNRMTNLLTETYVELLRNGKLTTDVLWVGTLKSYTDWETFYNTASIEYNSGFGGQEINPRLLVVGDDWWLERHEYDGSEWWEFKCLPIKPDEKMGVRLLVDYYYD